MHEEDTAMVQILSHIMKTFFLRVAVLFHTLKSTNLTISPK